jgi:cell division protein FtsI (penicillin-binding protein 3)
MSFEGFRPTFPSKDGLRQSLNYGINSNQGFASARAQVAVLPALEEARKRLLIVALGFLTCFLLISGRLFDVMIINTDADKSASTTPPPAIKRADIVDRNGELLATSLQMASLAADPAYIMDEKDTLTKLKKLFPELDTEALSKDFHNGKRFVWVKHDLTPQQEEAANALGLPGLSFEHEERRIYPKGALTSHIIGYNSVDQTGIAGIEHTFDKQLTGSGDPLPLSIDIGLQGILHEALAEGVKNFNATGAAGIIMDVRTGEILAMVSLPDFDPNVMGKVSDNAKFNRASLGSYEMGSTFKTFTLALALDKKLIKLTDTFDCIHPIQIGRFKITDFHPENRWLNVPEIYVYSSNLGAARIADKFTIEDQKKFLGALGLLSPTPLEISEISKPQVPGEWREINKTTISYGHGLAVNAVQLASAFATIVNGGYIVKPTLVKQDNMPPLGAQVISENTSIEMRKVMRAVVAQGTGKTADVKGYMVGGKTGTADKSANGGYNRNNRLASFISAFPINDPRYLVFAMIDEPKGNKASHGYATGGWVSAPVVGKVVAQSASLLRVPPVDASAEQSMALPVNVGKAGKGGHNDTSAPVKAPAVQAE